MGYICKFSLNSDPSCESKPLSTCPPQTRRCTGEHGISLIFTTPKIDRKPSYWITEFQLKVCRGTEKTSNIGKSPNGTGVESSKQKMATDRSADRIIDIYEYLRKEKYA